MSRTIKLYKMDIDHRYLTKSLTQIGNDITANFKDDTELIDPILILSSFNQNTTNYVEIPDLSRFYYVKGVTFSQGYYYVQLHVDVLMSFKDSIINQKAIIKRGNSYCSHYITDDQFKTQQYTCDRYVPFENDSAFDPTIQNYILAVMGTGGDTPDSDTVNVIINSGSTIDVTGSIGTHDDTPVPPINSGDNGGGNTENPINL